MQLFDIKTAACHLYCFFKVNICCVFLENLDSLSSILKALQLHRLYFQMLQGKLAVFISLNVKCK